MVTPIEIKGKTLGFIDSRIGGRKENQDSAGLKDTNLGYLVVVCDGMGGMQGGSAASQLAVQKILEVVVSADKQANPSMTLKKAIQNANIAIIEEGKNNPELQGMGTTVTALLLTPYSAITAYVGDSRVYQLRNGKKVFRTFDHSMVFEMVKKKVISEEQARLSAQSNIILKALGINSDIEVEVTERSYQKGDRFVLCTDGFWGAMPEEDFIRHLSEKNPINKILETTANVVESIGRTNGGEYDNLTAAILEMNRNSILKEKMNKLAKIIISILSILLVGSIALNILLIFKSKSNAIENLKKEIVNQENDMNVITGTVEEAKMQSISDKK
ncbi:PP2C family protein-serine/threonine phosphatase [Parabacteroides pacaensis]|uniref:PP2C family protein-serine/threonine phosphatase n=1 Tax=Parabacteroides pacaensis TaxID=2086575 RepID=UPI000D0EE97A|nr:protein phosphatase 2C domain-containing protein [Parabacteroides pacaensis]